jgi:hypothetical protein
MAKSFIPVRKKRSARRDSTSQHRVTALEPLAGSTSLILFDVQIRAHFPASLQCTS